MLGDLIEEVNKVIVLWKRKRRDQSETGFEPQPVEVATPSKFLRSQSCIDDLVSLCT